MTSEDLQVVLVKHAAWLKGDTNGVRADLRHEDLRYANLSLADLRHANLSSAVLGYANLSYANLSEANLSYANLSDANLNHVNLSGANLRHANLSYANLSGAKLSGANLTDAILIDAILSGVNPATLARTEILPREGEVIGWKKCSGGVLVKLRVLPDAKRSNATGRKCRASKVEVLEIHGAEVAYSYHDPDFKYVVGQTLTADYFEADRFRECAPGIHFFLTKEEAEAYVY